MIRKIPFAVMLCTLMVNAPFAYASFDMEDCNWSDDRCLLKGIPVLTPDNDSRDNLLRLLSEAKSFALPVQSMPADITRSRDFYFAFHPQWDEAASPAPAAAAAPQPDARLTEQLTALGIVPASITVQEDALENRFVSNNADSAGQFFAALLADTALNDAQRHTLAQARVALLSEAQPERIDDALAGLAADAPAQPYKTYLLAAARFYQGDYAAASQGFSTLVNSERPWLSETAQYMLMRTALNKSTQNSVGEYGDFDVERINRDDALQAQNEAQAYLQRWPEGRYAESAHGMLRRINWYLREWPQLAALYEQALAQTDSAQALRQQVIEYDNVFGMNFYGRAIVEAFPQAPLISYIEMMRALRLNSDEKPTLTQASLDSSKAVFEQAGKGALWRNLQRNLWMATGNYAAVVQDIAPAQQLPAHDILAFSEQVLYGEALMGQTQWQQRVISGDNCSTSPVMMNSGNMFRPNWRRPWSTAVTARRSSPRTAPSPVCVFVHRC